jgi:hypothetical protein
MAKPIASTGPPPHPLPSPIAEVQILVYALERGRSEIRVRLPDEAVSGRAGAARKQAAFRSLVLAELDEGLKALSE